MDDRRNLLKEMFERGAGGFGFERRIARRQPVAEFEVAELDR